MISPEFLAVICCPETHQPLRLAEPALLERINQQIASGQLRNRGGKLLTEKLTAALVRSDGKFAYPVRQDIPIMLIDEAVPLIAA